MDRLGGAKNMSILAGSRHPAHKKKQLAYRIFRLGTSRGCLTEYELILNGQTFKFWKIQIFYTRRYKNDAKNDRKSGTLFDPESC